MLNYDYTIKLDYQNVLTVEATQTDSDKKKTCTFDKDVWLIIGELAKDTDTRNITVNVATPPTKLDIKVLKFLMMSKNENIIVNNKALSWQYIKELESDRNERTIERENCKVSSETYQFIKDNLGIIELREFRKDPMEYCRELQHKIDLLGYDVSMSHDRPTPKKQAGHWTDGQGKHSYSRTTLDYNYRGYAETDVLELVKMYMNSLYYFFIGLEPEKKKDKRQKDELYKSLYNMTYEEYKNEVYRIKGYCSLVYEGDNITTPLSSCSLSVIDNVYSSL